MKRWQACLMTLPHRVRCRAASLAVAAAAAFAAYIAAAAAAVAGASLTFAAAIVRHCLRLDIKAPGLGVDFRESSKG